MRSPGKLVLLAALICAGSSHRLAAQPDDDDDDCPDVLRDVSLSLAQSTGGATIDFTTDDKQAVGDLRKLLREVSATLEYQSKLAALHPELVDADSEPIPPVHITVRNTPNGAQVILRSEDARDAKKVLVHARKFQSAWDASCTRRPNV